jgi:hypothetical protein
VWRLLVVNPHKQMFDALGKMAGKKPRFADHRPSARKDANARTKGCVPGRKPKITAEQLGGHWKNAEGRESAYAPHWRKVVDESSSSDDNAGL